MPTDYVSEWQIVDSADHTKPLTFTVFDTLEDAQQWVRGREADLYEATKSGSIGGTFLKETRIPARFIVTTPACRPYLGFGARVVQEVFVDAIPWLIIGLPREHAQWLIDRLWSGLIFRAGPFDTLEDALAQARS